MGWLQHLDPAPPFPELAGAPVPAAFRGQSLTQARSAADDRPVISEALWRGLERRAIRSRGWKLIVDDRAGTEALFELSKDPAERVNVAAHNLDVVTRLRSLMKETVHSPAAADPRSPAVSPNPELEAALRALGYLEPQKSP